MERHFCASVHRDSDWRISYLEMGEERRGVPKGNKIFFVFPLSTPFSFRLRFCSSVAISLPPPFPARATTVAEEKGKGDEMDIRSFPLQLVVKLRPVAEQKVVVPFVLAFFISSRIRLFLFFPRKKGLLLMKRRRRKEGISYFFSLRGFMNNFLF